MRIALDIDGTITRHPEFFALISEALVAAGHEVVVITFREDEAMTRADLEAWGIRYERLFLGHLDAVMEHGVDEWKGTLCAKLGVDLFFEDDPGVLRHVPEGVVCFMPVGGRELREAFGRVA